MVLATLSPRSFASSSSRFARAACIAVGLLMLAGMFASGAWEPSLLFRDGGPGVAFDLTKKSLLFQDSARTTLVAANGDPIGSVTDLSGNGYHAFQGTSTSRPSWTGTSANLDGADDGLETPPIDFGGSDTVVAMASLRKLSDAAIGTVMELGATYISRGFLLRTPSAAASASVLFGTAGSASTFVNYTNAAVTAPVNLVLTGIGRISTKTCVLRVNGVQVASSSADQGTGGHNNAAIYIGRRQSATVPLAADLCRMIVLGRMPSASELACSEAWLARPLGVVLP